MKNQILKNNILLNIFFIGILISITTSISAQYDAAKHGIGLRFNTINHDFPFTDQLIKKDIHTFGGEITYQYHLLPNFNLAVPLRLGYVDYYERDGSNTDMETISYQSIGTSVQAKFFKESALFSPYVHGGFNINFEQFADPSIQFPLGLGLNVRIAKHVYLSLQTEYRVAVKELRNGLTHGVGVVWFFNPDNFGKKIDVLPTDQDGDGVLDANDKCPKVAGLAMYAGCPDTDKDGVPDHKDQCPDVAGSRSNGGCPIDNNDEDNDGIPDEQDKCPNTVGLARFFGCPDSDGDGVADNEDRCPDIIGFAYLKGCPDTDGDGVAEPDDRCPNQFGTMANFGCPAIDIADQAFLNNAVQAIEFETSKALLKSTSFPTLDKIAALLQKYKGYKLQISGHTDSVGDDVSNLMLSEKRAKACYNFLIQRGVDPSRVTYIGLGETEPIADNSSFEGRQKNRRVEFEFYINK